LMAAVSGANAVVCMQQKSPTSCSSYSGPDYSATWSVSGCTGGSVASFGGEIRCSVTSGMYHKPGNPSGAPGQHCWCRLTSPGVSAWVYHYDEGNEDECWDYCAGGCAGAVKSNTNAVRDTMFSAIGA
jgi:hypothetical protein